MNLQMKHGLWMIVSFVVVLLVNGCQDPLYDLNKGIDTEIKVGGDSLTIPIGSTDTIKLSSFLSTDDLEFLEIMEDGGYGLRLSDSLYVNNLLKDLDKSKLKFDDFVFSDATTISFGDMSLNDVKIPGFTKKDTLDMNIPKIELGDIAPSINMNKQFSVGFSNYTPSNLDIADFSNITRQEDFLASQIPVNQATHPPVQFSSTEPITVTDASGNPLTMQINYSIDVPGGIKNIHRIDLEAGANLDISIEIEGAEATLSAGNFVPTLTIDPSNLFRFSPLTPLTNGKIIFDSSNSLTNFNAYKSSKAYNITAFENLPLAVNDKLAIEKSILVQGSITAQGTIRENKGLEAKQIDLIVNVSIKDLKLKNLDFDLPAFSTTINGTSPFAINETGLPAQVNKINTIYFEKAAGSALPTNMVILFKPSGLPEIQNADYTIKNLTIDFPAGFAFSNMAGKTYSVSNVPFNTTTGYKVELSLSEIDLSSVNIVNGTLNWSGDISYSGDISIAGRMESQNIGSSSNSVINLTTETAIKLKSASVVTNQINEQLEKSSIDFILDIDIPKEITRLTTVTMKRGSKIRVDINKPALPLTLNANNLQVKFSEMFEFFPIAGLNGSIYTINGAMPDFIELELKALHINKDLVDGKLTLNENVTIEGGVQLEAGTVNSEALNNLANNITLLVSVSDMYIASTSVEIETLEANYKDVTSINLDIDEIPSEIVALDSIILKSGSTIGMDINLTNLPNLGNNPLLATIKIKFPKLLAFASGQVNAQNEMIIEQAFVNGKLAKTINLRGLNFDGSPLNGKLSINEQVDFDVTVKIEDPTINSEDLNNDPVGVGINITMKGLEFQKVYGKFDLNLDDQLNIGNIQLDLPDMLKGNDVSLDIANPVLTLATESNIGIPVDAALGLTKFVNGTLMSNDKITVNFRLPKANSPSEIMKTFYWVSPTDDGKPSNYTFVQTNLQNLLKPLPDSVKLELVPTVDNSYQHLIDLMAVYNLKVKYDINIPFKFGKDLSITVRDTISDIDLGLGEDGINTGSLELLGTIHNSIPLNLELQLLLTDANFNILATTSKVSIAAGAPNGSAVASKLAIKLSDNLDDLKRLNKVILTFKATSNTTVAGTPIKPGNFIKAELKARVGGVKVTL
jgi:hypothetical protein